MAYDAETVDMSKIVQGGKKDATVTGLVSQELDPSKNVIFEWRSWDHFSFLDTTVSLTNPQIDLVQGNALALANDGNLLLSSRDLSEITKINLQTGDVIWRLGGKANMFQIVNGQPFAYQHDVRQLPNGDITVFDNQGTTQNPAASLAIEYQINETNKIATQVWSFTHGPAVFATYVGDAQRLSDGNIFLDWGAPFTGTGYVYDTMTEVAPDGHILFDLSFDSPYVSYRAFRFPWQGFPDTQPALASKVDGNGITLGYSWNGATEVAAYRIFGGSSAQSLGLIEEKTRTDFETQSHFANLPQGECYFQVAAVDKNGQEMARSETISTDLGCPPVP
ncbi:MAG: arylsulfotransferase family protein [Anaerolineales bacterium]|jgi:outer membrane protein assembly factor BamB